MSSSKDILLSLDLLSHCRCLKKNVQNKISTSGSSAVEKVWKIHSRGWCNVRRVEGGIKHGNESTSYQTISTVQLHRRKIITTEQGVILTKYNSYTDLVFSLKLHEEGGIVNIWVG